MRKTPRTLYSQLPSHTIVLLRKEYLGQKLHAYQVAEKLHINYSTVYTYFKEFDTIREQYPDKLHDLTFRMPKTYKRAQKSDKHQPMLDLLPQLIEADDSRQLSATKIWMEYRKVYPDGYCKTRFQSYFFKFLQDHHLNINSGSKVKQIAPADREVLDRWRIGNDHLAWQKAVTIIESFEGKAIDVICNKTETLKQTADKWILKFKKGGVDALRIKRQDLREKYKPRVEEKTERILALLHQPPRAYGFPDAAWKGKMLAEAYAATYGSTISTCMVFHYLNQRGFRFKQAKAVLTSNDPEFQKKVDKVLAIVRKLGPKDRFFSIDEMGPVSVRIKGGRSWMPKGETKVYPGKARIKDRLIITAAIELVTNQVTHFYSPKKTTGEMIKLIDMLVVQYTGMRKIYLSWDAASWHRSNKLKDHLKMLNDRAYRREHHTPWVGLATLPANAQFLNIIESVFSGLARSILHNSDYADATECKSAIDQYFTRRNNHFLENPKRAGNKIWGEENVVPVFKPSNTCKSVSADMFKIAFGKRAPADSRNAGSAKPATVNSAPAKRKRRAKSVSLKEGNHGKHPVMNIEDANGNPIEIRNLALDLMQADDYRHCAYLNPIQQQRVGWKLGSYWEDRYQKLLTLELQQQSVQGPQQAQAG